MFASYNVDTFLTSFCGFWLMIIGFHSWLTLNSAYYLVLDVIVLSVCYESLSQFVSQTCYKPEAAISMWWPTCWPVVAMHVHCSLTNIFHGLASASFYHYLMFGCDILVGHYVHGGWDMNARVHCVNCCIPFHDFWSYFIWYLIDLFIGYSWETFFFHYRWMGEFLGTHWSAWV